MPDKLSSAPKTPILVTCACLCLGAIALTAAANAAAVAALSPGQADSGATVVAGPLPPLAGSWSVQASGDEVLCVASPPDKPDEVWTGTEGGGLVIHRRGGGRFEQFLAPNQLGLTSNRIYDIAFDADHHAWLATGDGVVRVARSGDTARAVDAGDWRRYGAADGLPAGVIRAVAVAPNGSIWAGGSAGGAAMLAAGAGRFTSFEPVPLDAGSESPLAGPAIGPVVDIAATADGRVWLAHGRLGRAAQPALSVFDPTRSGWRHVASDGPGGSGTSGPASDQIMGLAAAADGSLWMATWGRGVLRYDGRTWRQYGRAPGACPAQKSWAVAARGDDVWAVCGDDNGHSAGIAAWNGREWRFQAASDLTEGTVVAVAAIQDDLLLLGTNGPGDDGGGVIVAARRGAADGGPLLATDARLRTAGTAPASNDITALIETRAGLFAGTRSAGLLRYDGTVWTQFTRQNTGSGLAGDAITAFALRRDELWVASTKSIFEGGAYVDGGVSAINLSTWRWRPPLRSTNSALPDDEVSSLAVTDDGRVWMGTGMATGGVGSAATYRGNGLSVFDPANGSWQHFRAGLSGPLAGDTVLGLAALGTDVWVASGYAERASDLRREGGGVNLLEARSAEPRWSTWRFGSPGFESVFQLGDAPEQDDLITGDVRAAAAGAGQAWVGTWSVAQGQSVGKWPYVDAVVNRFADGAWHASRWPVNGWTSALALDGAGRLWAGFSRGHERQEFAPASGVVVDAPSREAAEVPPATPANTPSAAAVWAGDRWLAPEGLLAGAVTAFAIDPGGESVWIGTENDGLWRFAPVVRGAFKAYLPRSVR